jgi:hypothetical protein
LQKGYLIEVLMMFSKLTMIADKVSSMISAHKEMRRKAFIDEAIAAVKACRVVACNKIWVGADIELHATYLLSSVDFDDVIGVEFSGKTKNSSYCKIVYKRNHPLVISELSIDEFIVMNSPEFGLELA